MSTVPERATPGERTGAAPRDALGPAPHSPVRAAITRRLFRRAVRDLPVRIELAGGERPGTGGEGAPLMRIERPEAFFHRLGADAKIGFGEAYMAGDWTSPDLAALLTPFAERLPSLVPKPLQLARRWVDARQPATDRSTTTGARRNIERHYDLSNDFFSMFLDETMTYSAGLFEGGHGDLGAAQIRKIDRVLDLARVGPGTALLEIGTGWGSLAIRAARRGADVTTVTLSAEQEAWAQKCIAEEGLDGRIEVRLCDYREVRGSFDAVVSVEMIEALGREFWRNYFRALDQLVRPGGRVALQTITMPHARMLATSRSYTWIHKYIFPGGLIPSLTGVRETASKHTSLRATDGDSFGTSYAETLAHWRHRFQQRWDEIEALGFNDRFRRMWEFYLGYSEAGFRSGYLNVWQLGFSKPAHG